MDYAPTPTSITDPHIVRSLPFVFFSKMSCPHSEQKSSIVLSVVLSATTGIFKVLHIGWRTTFSISNIQLKTLSIVSHENMWMSDGMSIKIVCVAQWNSRNDAGKVLWFPFLGLASPQNLWLNHWAIWKYLNVCILSSYDWIDSAWTFRKAIDKCVWLLWQRSCLNWITGQRGRVWMSFILKVSSFQWEIY